MPTNFLQWNPQSINQETDAQYSGDTQRQNGATVNAAFPSATANKLFYQVSTLAAALAQALTTKGYSIQDSPFSALASVLGNLMTLADMVPYAPLNSPVFTGQVTVPTQGYEAATNMATSAQYVEQYFMLKSAMTAYATEAWVQSLYATMSYVNGQFAPLLNAVLQGTPTTPTPSATDNSQIIANTAWVDWQFPRFSAFSSSFGDSGWQMFPTSGGAGTQGLMIQWGSGNAPTGNGDVLPFTRPFTQNVFQIFGQDGGSPSGTPTSACNSVSAMWIPGGSQYLTNFRVFARSPGTGNFANTNVNWFAIGV